VDSFFTIRLPVLGTGTRDKSVAQPEIADATATELSDEALLAQICNGTREALGLLFSRYARTVRGVAYRVLRDPSEADDLLQDIFLLIHRKCGMFDPSRGPARFWILQMTYHRALARRRYLNARHFYTKIAIKEMEDCLPDQGSGDSLSLLLAENPMGNSRLKEVFNSLSHDQRETLHLFFVEGYTLGEIAAKMNQTRSNVKHYYFRGLEKLRRQLFPGKLPGNSAV